MQTIPACTRANVANLAILPFGDQNLVKIASCRAMGIVISVISVTSNFSPSSQDFGMLIQDAGAATAPLALRI
jgi:hypothetical protein